jgi:ubiquinone/menaquinone biosynthesis C-methylase UbiE
MSRSGHQSEALDERIIHYYMQGKEATRLTVGIGPLEYARTKELIRRYLPETPQSILDVGGGPGVHACWLARKGHEVHPVDVLPLHVDQGRQASEAQPDAPLASYLVGDARRLPVRASIVDAVLLYSPLYHFLEKDDRLRALRKCWPALRQGGLLVAVGISRFASLHVGLVRGWIDDDDFRQMVENELADGKHYPPSGLPALFARAYFHHPDELSSEVVEAGYERLATVAVEGTGWLVPDLDDNRHVRRQREAILSAVRWTENEHTILGLSPHIMVVARK